jgi:bifunctional non-homologous end joining protein LigD
MYSRNHQALNGYYPEMVVSLTKLLPRDCVVDGELVTFQPGTSLTSFHLLQKRMHARTPSPELIRRIPVHYYLFDLLWLDGRDLRRLPLLERKSLLERSVRWKAPLRLSTHSEKEGEQLFQHACRLGWEGLIAKRSDSVYLSGRSRDWLKLKCVNEQEFVIGGYSDPQGARDAFGALLVGYFEGPDLMYAGKVGTGFDTETLQLVYDKLRPLITKKCPFKRVQGSQRGLHWIEPKLVAQVAFSEWTPDGKLRHPRYLGLRDDKSAREVIRERKKPLSLVA